VAAATEVTDTAVALPDSRDERDADDADEEVEVVIVVGTTRSLRSTPEGRVQCESWCLWSSQYSRPAASVLRSQRSTEALCTALATAAAVRGDTPGGTVTTGAALSTTVSESLAPLGRDHEVCLVLWSSQNCRPSGAVFFWYLGIVLAIWCRVDGGSEPSLPLSRSINQSLFGLTSLNEGCGGGGGGGGGGGVSERRR